MHIMKFGGSTLKNAENCKRVADVVRAAHQNGPVVVVVSALYGVTNRLLTLIDAAKSSNGKIWHKELQSLIQLHQHTLDALVPKFQQKIALAAIHDLFSELTELCDGIAHLQECSPRTQDRVIGFGELLSSQIIAAMLASKKIPALAADARQFIVTDSNFGAANVDMAISRKLTKTAASQWKKKVPVITGFIAATVDGIPTTVGRNGSDYTAALVGALLDANKIEIWSDVDGVLSADPRVVKDAFPLTQLSFAEAMELAYFGAKVLHPRAVIPAVEAGIPLVMRNILNIKFPGTIITHKPDLGGPIIKGITSIPDMSLLTLEGAGMVGVVGISARLFDTLARAGINVTLISQASSEQSICCVVKQSDAARAVAVLKNEFESECRRKQIRRIATLDDITVIAVVGSAMRGTPGIAGRLFSSLGNNHINVIAVAQGSSEQNISFVVPSTDHIKALNVIHGAFHLAKRHVHVAIIGKGAIGKALINQIRDGQTRLNRDNDLDLRVVGIANSRHFLFNTDGISLKTWEQQLNACRSKMTLDHFTTMLEESHLENLIIVDATANEMVAQQFPTWLGKGFSVVTPNKKANTLSQKFYNELQTAVRKRNSYYYCEACVGAGLPIISTLQDLLNSGDDIIHIEGLLSGTLGYLFSELEKEKSFSAIVKKAHEMRYTEPDPRDDLSGMDVARKLVILARLCGAHVELSKVKIEPLLPAALWKAKSVAEFFKELPQVDTLYAKKMAAAKNSGKVLRYIGRIKDGKCAIELRAVERNSPFGNLVGGDNMVIFTTKRYLKNPLIVRGPGAGPEVTAGGVFADILKVANLLTS
ncbi:MAG: bifunctional aspartate kinase/homoserine dehydrogenase I [Deltaproteobacteria bacterium CG11_big_fil_rev_8_21_14_0_20_47_16]|nr:MAG: bifunctional aspartate kinase/homoserine dehydrogenase I [Deltaproteobacteria bacterium CG11_big_fil_rev_8_21_14_0_20_47_16]